MCKRQIALVIGLAAVTACGGAMIHLEWDDEAVVAYAAQ